MPDRFACGLVLAAGGSTRLGRPKQLLPFGAGTLLDAVLDVARACPFDQLLCVIGGAADEVCAAVDFSGVTVVHNSAFGTGCSSSIAAALAAVDPRTDVLVLMLGDQPGVSADGVRALLAAAEPGTAPGAAPITACRYADGRGHPLAFDRSLFGELGALHGDKAVWKLMDRCPVREVPVAGPLPGDVDTWEDYRALVGRAGSSNISTPD